MELLSTRVWPGGRLGGSRTRESTKDRTRDGTKFYRCVLVQVQVHLTVLAMWILLVHTGPTTAIYLDFVSSNPLDPSAAIQDGGAGEETLSWAVKIQHHAHRKTVNRTRVDLLADLIADDLRLKNYGQVGELIGHYLFVADSYHDALNGSLNWDLVRKIRSRTEGALTRHPFIKWFNQQTIRRRYKRSVEFSDPSYPNQWHLHNSKNKGMDINITGIWQHNITGAGVTVAVIDDGLEWMNDDIHENYCAEGSWDLNSNDNNPMPEMRIKDGKQTQNRHGTRCAGEIAAARNNVCGVGVAYKAKVSGIRLLDGPMTDSLEATAFNKFMYINDIYSCSWGPDDDGKTVDGPHTLAKAALQHGVTYGRRGRGSIFVVASGNGGKNGDNCNYDGYANSMYTVTIGAVDEKGQMPFYAEECSSLFAVTYSSGSRPQRNIVTTDWTLGSGTGCTNTHTGTSAAAPLAAGMISLMLEAKPCLSWRDIQHIIVNTALKIDDKKGDWTVNAAGFHHSHKHGFGVLKAWQLVNAAKVWPSVPWLTSVISQTMKTHREIPIAKNQESLTVEYQVTNATAHTQELSTLEHVLITLSLSHTVRGKLRIELVCPSGTRSVIGARRKKDISRDGLHDWTFSTVRCWGEEPVGLWQLIITDFSTSGGGVLEDWSIALYGSNMKTADIQERKGLVAESYGGEFLDTNLTEPCSFYWAAPMEEEPYLSLQTVKFLLLISGFSTVLALYYSLEQAFCTDDEKKKHAAKVSEDTAPSGDATDQEQSSLLPMVDLTSADLQEVTSRDLQQGTSVDELQDFSVTVAKGRLVEVTESCKLDGGASEAPERRRLDMVEGHKSDASDSTKESLHVSIAPTTSRVGPEIVEQKGQEKEVDVVEHLESVSYVQSRVSPSGPLHAASVLGFADNFVKPQPSGLVIAASVEGTRMSSTGPLVVASGTGFDDDFINSRLGLSASNGTGVSSSGPLGASSLHGFSDNNVCTRPEAPSIRHAHVDVHHAQSHSRPVLSAEYQRTLTPNQTDPSFVFVNGTHCEQKDSLSTDVNCGHYKLAEHLPVGVNGPIRDEQDPLIVALDATFQNRHVHVPALPVIPPLSSKHEKESSIMDHSCPSDAENAHQTIDLDTKDLHLNVPAKLPNASHPNAKRMEEIVPPIANTESLISLMLDDLDPNHVHSEPHTVSDSLVSEHDNMSAGSAPQTSITIVNQENRVPPFLSQKL